MKPFIFPTMSYFEDFDTQKDFSGFPNTVIPLKNLLKCLPIQYIYQCLLKGLSIKDGYVYIPIEGMLYNYSGFRDGYLSEFIVLESSGLFIYQNEDILAGNLTPRFSLLDEEMLGKSVDLIQYIRRFDYEFLSLAFPLYTLHPTYFFIIRHKDRTYHIKDPRLDGCVIVDLQPCGNHIVISTERYGDGFVNQWAFCPSTRRLAHIGQNRQPSVYQDGKDDKGGLGLFNYDGFSLEIGGTIRYKGMKLCNIRYKTSQMDRDKEFAIAIPNRWDLSTPKVHQKIVDLYEKAQSPYPLVPYLISLTF